MILGKVILGIGVHGIHGAQMPSNGCSDPNDKWSHDKYDFDCSDTNYNKKTSCVVTCNNGK